MSRRILISIAAALALAPLGVFAADGAPSSAKNCHCSQMSAKSTARPATVNTAPVNTYQGLTRAELERLWAPSP